MKPSDLTQYAAGSVIKMPSGYWAFLPATLPPALDLGALAFDLSEADARLSELSGLGKRLPNPHLLIAPYVNREAVASSQIEGTQADLSDLLLDEATPERTPPASDVSEIRNYVAALDLGVKLLDELPPAGRLVRRMHETLMAGARGGTLSPGEFRRSQNWIRGSGPADAYYVPPPPDRLAGCIGGWEKFVNQRDVLPPLVQCAVMHQAFEAIHPFLDGNGRIGRLLVTLFLMERGRLSRPLLYLSSYIERTKDVYYDRLHGVNTRGEWTAWVRYFLRGVADSAAEASAQVDALLDLRDRLRATPELAAKHREQVLIDHLFHNPYLTVSRAAGLLGVSVPAAARSIKLLESLGVLREATGKTWGRAWLADPIRAVIGGPPGEPAE